MTRGLGGGTLRLWRLIRVLWLIRGTGMHRINHEAWIRHENVAEAADVRVAAPRRRRSRRRAPQPQCIRALVTTTARWALLAAVVTTAVALVIAAVPARRGLTRTTDSGAPPVRPAGGTPDRG
jgi:hypothetical protein